MLAKLTIVRYPSWLGWAGFLSMALFRIPLFFRKDLHFWKLMGCGRNGSFDKTPDWRQWAVLEVMDAKQPASSSSFMQVWWRFFNCEKWELLLNPIEGHGLWDGQEVFGALPKQTDYTGRIAVLTRATIRISQLSRFWQHVDAIASRMASAPGFITSVGIGEVPWIKQATFSIWASKEDMKSFAYRLQEHAEVVRKTKQEKWYSEDMFVRFEILDSKGSLNGKDPLERNP